MRIPTILHHGALAIILTIVDEIVRRCLAVPSVKAFDATRTLFASYQAEIEATTWHSPIVLSVATLPALALLIVLGSQMRHASRRRSQRAEARVKTADEGASRIEDVD